MHSSDFPTPGLKKRPNRDGTTRLIWVARADIAKAGYEPKTIRLHYDAADLHLISAACQRYQAEMLEWSSGHRSDALRFDGTIASLVKRYQRDPASPYAGIKWNTRVVYDHVLGVIETAFGRRVLDNIRNEDFRRWYDEAEKPKTEGGPKRTRKAHGIISMLRRLMTFGVAAELPGCERLQKILNAMEFKQPAPRRIKLEFHHVEAFIKAALSADRHSLALGTALQFETTLRQKDVIGEWEPVTDADGGIRLNDARWVNGLTWADLNAKMEIRKDTTKTGATSAHDLTLCPMTMALLDLVPTEARIGPLIIDEKSRRPYATDGYTREWRVIANLAGIPKTVKNMDARAGGISEADEAGADIDQIRSAAAHSQASTTARYIRGTIGKSRAVATLRAAHRKKKNVP